MRFQQRSCGSIEKLRPLQTSAFAVNQRAFGVVMIIGSLVDAWPERRSFRAAF